MEMIEHKICARHSKVKQPDRLSIPLVKHCIRITLHSERVNMPCEVNVFIADDKVIREINREFRGIDSPTDVLSFPMHTFSPPGWSAPGTEAVDPETGLLPLGEIVFSAQRVHAQALEYGRLLDKETAFLTVHSVLHLLGYDHVAQAGDRRKMREHEKKIMHDMGYSF